MDLISEGSQGSAKPRLQAGSRGDEKKSAKIIPSRAIEQLLQEKVPTEAFEYQEGGGLAALSIWLEP